MDLRLMSAEANDAERAAVNELLGAPDSGWDGGDRSAADHHIARGGVRQTSGVRHLLLPALQAVQGAIGWVSPGALNYVSERLTVPPAEAYAVATFYALLATEERPRRVAHVCEDVSCRNRGGLDLLEELSGRGDVMASPCLGQCDRSPAVLVQRAGEYDASLWNSTPEMVIDVLEGAEPIDPNPGHYGIPQTEAGSDGLRLLHRVGAIDPYSLDEYRAADGYAALTKAMEMTPTELIEEVKRSGIKGRGGAAFPMGVKWEAVVAQESDPVLVCNADEAEPGTFKDRGIMEGDPFSLVEAMTIAGYTLGAHRSYLYIRGEYPRAARHVASAIEVAKEAGLLGEDILGSGFDFDIEIRMGGGAYICGEETALFNSIEGFRGEPRQKPPYPAEAGLFGLPTAINNVETLINLPLIVLEGGDAYAALGTPDSTGIKLFCLSGDVVTPGVYEVEFGATIRDLIELAGGPLDDIAAVLLGGVSGSFVGPDQLDLPLTFEATREAGVALGTAVVMPFSSSTDFDDVTKRIAAFFRDESCGQCVPCRVGTVRQEEALFRLLNPAPTNGSAGEIGLLTEIDQAMKLGSICGLGHTAGSAIQSAIALGLIGDRG
ncbi:MAG: NADH-quinone oxidoreductase subunit E [Acidimicrobiia bacterium]|nr:NAD(P)H-dependent oxidoreductase subunit E [Acidimicrobiia bacterium]MBT8246580.1 NAD(P)H-dependent oxidoreductase subunit E [Acidimicrobiia bacterium]NNF88286.1 NADH-quinone oxidoreductase subunit E [Acidimicrobiia bacterium]NNL14402.1 NADH-quinone oxidoreductase subunit E [Acidimicrobiia bacterium]NNL98296.1 NADH-quinone oxidoreductase subunit E [Acidimicrobiia bacterium]